MRLDKLLRLQFFYCLLAILFNVLSWIMIVSKDTPLTPTAPMSGVIVMLIFGVFLLAGRFRKIMLYRFLMLLAVIVFGYGGIVKHLGLLRESPELYYSLWVGVVAIAINVFGFGLNAYAVLGFFKNSD